MIGRFFLPAATLMVVASPQTTAQENWPQWRGPTANGVSTATGLPVEWSLEKNIVWKAELPSWSGATPIIWGDRIFITSPSRVDQAAVEAEQQRQTQERQQQAGRQRGGQQRRGRGRGGRQRGRGGRGGGRGGGRQARDPGGQKLLVMCISKRTGEVLWRRELDEGNQLHRKQNNTSPSPVTDGENLWVVTGNGVITMLDMEGEPVWQQRLQDLYVPFGHNWGYACSPLLHDGKLITQVLHGMKTDDPSYVAAFDAKTGKALWQQERWTDALRESPDSYTTPAVLEVNGKTQIVITGGDYVTGHDLETGEEIWRVPGLNPNRSTSFRIVSSPVAIDGMVYAPTRVRPLLAIAMGEDGLASADTIAWKWDDRGGPDVPTPVCDGTWFYMVNDQGLVTKIDAKTGEIAWGPERTVAGTVSSSPFLSEGKLYFTTEEGLTAVVSVGSKLEVLASNELDGSYTLSSPVPSGNQLFVRTATHLYCIGTGQK